MLFKIKLNVIISFFRYLPNEIIPCYLHYLLTCIVFIFDDANVQNHNLRFFFCLNKLSFLQIFKFEQNKANKRNRLKWIRFLSWFHISCYNGEGGGDPSSQDLISKVKKYLPILILIQGLLILMFLIDLSQCYLYRKYFIFLVIHLFSFHFRYVKHT